MATPAQLLAAIASRVSSTLGAPSRLSSDYRDDLPAVDAGAYGFQLRGAPIGLDRRSNTTYRRMQVAVTLVRRLGQGEAETDWTEGGLLTHLSTLADPEWWRALAEVHEVVTDPQQFGTTVERDGNIITATVEATLDLAP